MKRTTGFTLFELTVVLAVVGVLIAVAAPSFTSLIEKRRIAGAAELIYGRLVLARNEAIKHSRPIGVQFAADGSDRWALGISDGTVYANGLCNPFITDLNDTTACTIDFDNNPATDDRVLMRMDSTDMPGVRMRGLSGNAPSYTGSPGQCPINGQKPMTCFDPVRGLARNGRVVLFSDRYEVHVITGILGRTRICSPNGQKKVVDYPNC